MTVIRFECNSKGFPENSSIWLARSPGRARQVAYLVITGKGLVMYHGSYLYKGHQVADSVFLKVTRYENFVSSIEY